jgi:UDP-hydrolysing UDP-N-acetyl-D-glucosamine 2-epimerase
MRSVGVVTVARSDYGIYLPILRAIESAPDLSLKLFVSGMHLSPEFGLTVKDIESDGFDICEQIEMLVSSDSPEGIVKSIGLGVIGFAQVFSRSRPDILVVLGDRFEMYAATLAALPFKIPVAHIHGGEITLGAIDESLRHSMTKLSHLHFTSTAEYAGRVIQLGEEPWRVKVSGALSLDNLNDLDLMNRQELSENFNITLSDAPFLLVTYHPVSLEFEKTEWQFGELLAALGECDLPVIFTMPNADTGGRGIHSMIKKYIEKHRSAQMVENFGTQGYFSMMTEAMAMVGNSSSGIIEAASFHLPVVNIGTRQQGRLRGKNIIDVDYDRNQILIGLQKALDPQFQDQIMKLVNPYGDGTAAEKIIRVLKTVEIDERLLMKRFHDVDGVLNRS